MLRKVIYGSSVHRFLLLRMRKSPCGSYQLPFVAT